MKKKSLWPLPLAFAAFILGLPVSIGVSAKLFSLPYKTHIEIDGKNYGVFENVSELEDLVSQFETQDGVVARVTLKREFVTDQSLFLWAKRASESRPHSSNIRLILKMDGGSEIARYTLSRCTPLSWTFESSGPAIGGFYEKVEMAVQEITLD